MLVRIDTASSEPIYVQIVAAVRLAIARGDVRVGERLPAARDLARSLDVNVHTVLRAYGELRDAGEIELRRGRGATVLRRPELSKDVAAALEKLLVVARREGVSLAELREALDKGGER